MKSWNKFWKPRDLRRRHATTNLVRALSSARKKQKQKLRPAYNREWFVDAPAIIAVCVDTKSAWRRLDGISYGFVDAAIVMDHIILVATELGLGTCWIGSFKLHEAQEALGLPDHIHPVVFSPLGYPNQTMPARKRKEINEFARYDCF
jgi:nitroreductase